MKDKMIVKNFYEKIVSENRLEELPKYVSENCVLNLGDKIVPLGLDGMKQHLVAVKRTYPDYTMKIVRQFSDKEYVISEFIMTGTHEGEWIGIKPTHKKLSFTGVNKVGGQAVLGRQHLKPTPWLTERHGYDPT